MPLTQAQEKPPVVEGFVQPGVKLPNRSLRKKKVSAAALYVDYFPHDHSLHCKFLLLCGFIH